MPELSAVCFAIAGLGLLWLGNAWYRYERRRKAGLKKSQDHLARALISHWDPGPDWVPDLWRYGYFTLPDHPNCRLSWNATAAEIADPRLWMDWDGLEWPDLYFPRLTAFCRVEAIEREWRNPPVIESMAQFESIYGGNWVEAAGLDGYVDALVAKGHSRAVAIEAVRRFATPKA